MGFWFWFWIFGAIAVVALVAYAAIGVALFKRATKLAEPVARLTELSDKLHAVTGEGEVAHSPISALDTPSLEVTMRRNELKRAKRERKEARTRRLVKRIKDIDFDESRLL
ncbi:MAG: hypothetical protein ACKOOD_04165 [Microbacteriaceae bacterium]